MHCPLRCINYSLIAACKKVRVNVHNCCWCCYYFTNSLQVFGGAVLENTTDSPHCSFECIRKLFYSHIGSEEYTPVNNTLKSVLRAWFGEDINFNKPLPLKVFFFFFSFPSSMKFKLKPQYETTSTLGHVIRKPPSLQSQCRGWSEKDFTFTMLARQLLPFVNSLDV